MLKSITCIWRHFKGIGAFQVPIKTIKLKYHKWYFTDFYTFFDTDLKLTYAEYSFV